MPINSKTHLGQRVAAVCLLLGSAPSWALNLFACEPEYASLAKELAPQAQIFSATTSWQDPHQVQAKPSLIAKMRQADLAICAGADLEVGWLPMLQMKANNPAVRDGQLGMFYASDHVEALDQITQVDRSMGDLHALGNPHFQFSPQRIAQIATALTQRLGLIDPSNQTQYQTNLAQFTARWQQATAQWQQQAQPLKGMKVIAYHSNFRYLFAWLEIKQVADLEPKPGVPPSVSHLANLLQRTKQNDIAAVIYTDYQDAQGAQWLSQQAALPLLKLPVAPNDQIRDLFALYERTLQQLLTLPQG